MVGLVSGSVHIEIDVDVPLRSPLALHVTTILHLTKVQLKDANILRACVQLKERGFGKRKSSQ